jgi:hypothetical protein
MPSEIRWYVKNHTHYPQVCDWILDPTNYVAFEAMLEAAGYRYPTNFRSDLYDCRCPITDDDLSDPGHGVSSPSDSFSHHSDYVITANGRAIHRSGATRIPEDECHEVFGHRTSLYLGWDDVIEVHGTPHCRSYVDDNAFFCDTCDAWRWNDEVSESAGCEVCEHPCNDNEDEDEEETALDIERRVLDTIFGARRTSLHPYNDTTASRFKSFARAGEGRVGLELELLVHNALDSYISSNKRTAFVEQAAFRIYEAFPSDYLILKRDGSLQECGLELVTRPDAVRVHKFMLAEGWSRLPLNDFTNEAPEIDAGLHVHVERQGKSSWHLCKIANFIYRASNRPWLITLAARDCQRYARLVDANRWSLLHQPPRNTLSAAANDPEKYVALRIRSRTLEFRLFKAFVKLGDIFARLEFVDALTHFTRYAPPNDLTHSKFSSFALRYPKQFPNLAALLESEEFSKFQPRTRKKK